MNKILFLCNQAYAHAENQDLRIFLRSPVIHPNIKAKAVRSIFTDKVDELTLRFIEKMVNLRRENARLLMADQGYNRPKTPVRALKEAPWRSGTVGDGSWLSA